MRRDSPPGEKNLFFQDYKPIERKQQIPTKNPPNSGNVLRHKILTQRRSKLRGLRSSYNDFSRNPTTQRAYHELRRNNSLNDFPVFQNSDTKMEKENGSKAKYDFL